jgi:hypothetical protein
MIRRLQADDWDDWLPLWNGYLRFYREPLPEELTRLTFERLCERRDGMLGLVALDDSGGSVGIAHLVFHPTTWSETNKCYLEDLFGAEVGAGRSSRPSTPRRKRPAPARSTGTPSSSTLPAAPSTTPSLTTPRSSFTSTN